MFPEVVIFPETVVVITPEASIVVPLGIVETTVGSTLWASWLINTFTWLRSISLVAIADLVAIVFFFNG